MRKTVFLAALAAVLLGSACSTMPPGGMEARTALPANAAGQPWQRAQAAISATENDIAKTGIRGIGPHVAALEDALAHADHPFGDMAPENGDRIVLVDGQTENLSALLIATGATDGRKTVTVANPYPLASFLLGTYYNDIEKPADALRVLDAGLALPGPISGAPSGQMRPSLISERGVALMALKRWPEALADYESGLELKALDNPLKARLLRGRAFVLVELGRLDEAEATLGESLIAEPNNPLALNELRYIARLRMGGVPTAPVILLPNPQ